MLLKTETIDQTGATIVVGDGIKCDLCKSIHKEKFVYYSLNFTRIMVHVSDKNTYPSQKEFDIDICTKCFEQMKDGSLKFAQNGAIKIICDFCGKSHISDIFQYYNVEFDEVDVNRDRDVVIEVNKNIIRLSICTECVIGIITKKEK